MRLKNLFGVTCAGHRVGRRLRSWLRQGIHRRRFLVARYLKGLDYLRRQHGMIPLLLGHSAIETIHDPRVASYTSYQLRLHKRARGLVQDNMDAIGFPRAGSSRAE